MDYIDCLMIQELTRKLKEDRERKEIIKAQFAILMKVAEA